MYSKYGIHEKGNVKWREVSNNYFNLIILLS